VLKLRNKYLIMIFVLLAFGLFVLSGCSQNVGRGFLRNNLDTDAQRANLDNEGDGVFETPPTPWSCIGYRSEPNENGRYTDIWDSANDQSCVSSPEEGETGCSEGSQYDTVSCADTRQPTPTGGSPKSGARK